MKFAGANAILGLYRRKGFEFYVTGKRFSNKVLERLGEVAQERAAAEQRRAELVKRSPNVQQQRWDKQPFFVRHASSRLRMSAEVLATIFIAGGLSELTGISFLVFYIALASLFIWDAWRRAKRRYGLSKRRDGE
ncbi:MAG TPA: hypothetical protein VE079_11245 [Ensifer sp.]|nr:hypothetical protein [Ensifer sp.]